jgi:hypothetical protein
MYTLQSSQFSIRNTLICRLRKKDKFNKFWKKKKTLFMRPYLFLLFSPMKKYKIFRIAILHDGSVYFWFYLCIFFCFFKKLLNLFF